MGQDEIIEALGSKKLTRKEIQEIVSLGQQAVSHSLKQLLKYNEIKKEWGGRVPIYNINIKIEKKKKGGAANPPK